MQPFIALSFLSLTYVALRLKIPNRKSNTIDSNNASAIIINNLKFGYSKENFVLKNLAIKIQAGQMVAIIGPNGAGKTTLFDQIILSKVKEVQINIENNDKLGLVFQHNDILWDEFNVKEHLNFYADLLDIQTYNHSDELLQILGLI